MSDVSSPDPRERPGGPPRVELERIRSAARRGLFGTGSSTKVGRYTLLEPLGIGASGRVYAAYDPELDRKIALKLVATGGPDENERARLLREAQAGARLSHPNVIHVYDTGVHEDVVYIAMQHVEGRTVARWLLGTHSLEEILDVFFQAGEGLVAAHEMGLVHRDFKPQNVILGDDGRVRVVDFGLARGAGPATASESLVAAREAEPDARPLVDVPLTEPGAVMGTPAYMSPEQHRGIEADARTDQFSYAVALWEAVFRRHPFRGSGEELVRAVVRGERCPPPTDRAAPRWLVRALDRALAGDPAARHPSMRALLDALAAGRTRRSSMRRAIAIAGLALGLVLALGWWSTATPNACPPVVERLEGVWDEGRREHAERSFLDRAGARARSEWREAEAGIDRYARVWATDYERVCARLSENPAHPESLEALACLQRSLDKLDAFTAAPTLPTPSPPNCSE